MPAERALRPQIRPVELFDVTRPAAKRCGPENARKSKTASMAEVTEAQVRQAVEEAAERDPEFLASLTEGRSSQRDVRQIAARRLDVDDELLKPFKKTIKAVMTDLWTAPDADVAALEAPKPKKKRVSKPKKKSPPKATAPKPETAAPAEEAPESLLRGTLSIDKTGRLAWAGAWAFGADAWKRGEKSKFRLATKKPLVLKDITEAKLGDVIQGGRWLACKGWFCLKTADPHAPKAKEKEFQARLRFVQHDDKWAVEGRGANRFGRWSLASKLCDLSDGRCAASRSYGPVLEGTSLLASDTLLDDDEDDENFEGEDSDEKDPAKPKRAPPIQLRGRIGGNDGVYTWSGRWAESKRQLESDSGAFSLRGTSTRDTGQSGIPAHLDLSGGFEMKDRTIREPVVSLHLGEADAEGTREASGRGQNEFGDFRLRGTLSLDGELNCTKRYSKPRPVSSDEDDSDDEHSKDPEELTQLVAEAADFTAQTAPRAKRQAASHAERAMSQKNLRGERGSLIAWDRHGLETEVGALKATIAAGSTEQPVVMHLRALHAKSLTVDLLSETGVGKVVAQLRKHESTKVSAMAAALVKKWKGLVTAQK